MFRELLTRATADGSRTNALNHLHWLLIAFAAIIAALFAAGVPMFLIYVFTVFECAVFIAYLVTHFWFMVKNPDALRSEKFTIQKMAIERGLYGDSTSGMMERIRGSPNPLLGPADPTDGA